MRRIAIAVLSLLLVFAAAADAGARTKRVHWFQNAGVADRFFDQIGFIPVNGIQEPGGPAQTVRSGSTTYKVLTWTNSLYNRRTTKALLKEIHRDARFPPVRSGAFTDAPLSGKWKRRFDVLIDLARDADVLLVARENPVCQSGLTRAQARGIARGEITQWSQVGAPGLGAIKRRLTGSEAFAQPRFGAQAKPGKGVVRRDGGVSEIAGDPSVAAVAPWSRVRFNRSVCAVPIDGVAPTDQTVFRREYKPAYPIQYVMHVKRRKDREGRAMVKAYVDFMKSARAAEMLRGTGVLLVADGEPAASGGGGGGGGSALAAPAEDHAGRPITAVRDDAGADQAMRGKRLQDQSQRLIFEANGDYEQRVLAEDGSCVGGTSSTWALLDGYTYAEHGGGRIARVRVHFDDYERLFTIDLPNAEPGTAYVDGQPYVDDPSLSGDCV